MQNLTKNIKRYIGTFVLMGLTFVFTSCGLFNNSEKPGLFNGAPATTQAQGGVSVALLLPLTDLGSGAAIARSMSKASELAIDSFANLGISPDAITLVTYDTKGSAAGAKEAAEQALNKGAQVIIGPVFAQSAQEVYKVASTRGVPVIAFTTDANVANAGMYLLSFLPDSEVERIVRFAVSKGKTSFAALVPDTPNGAVVSASFQSWVNRMGGRIVALEQFRPVTSAGLNEPITSLSSVKSQFDVLFVPYEGRLIEDIFVKLREKGITTSNTLIIGTGAYWDTTSVWKARGSDGSYYSSSQADGLEGFQNTYKKKYGEDPERIATLAFDAVILSATLANNYGIGGFSPQFLTNPKGFSGIDGIFRFTPQGLNERGLAVFKIQGGRPKIETPAPDGFE